MNENETGRRKKSLVIKVVIPVVLVCVVAGIWLFKNAGSSPAQPGAAQSATGDFQLTVGDGLDLDHLKGYGVPIILKFGAEWCGPCQELAPIIDELHTEVDGRAIIKDIDVDEYADLSQEYPVTVIPTMVLIDSDGNPYASQGSVLPLKYYSSRETGEHIFTTIEGVLTKDQLVALLTDMGMDEQ